MSRIRASLRLGAVALLTPLGWSSLAHGQDYAWNPTDVEARRGAFIDRMVAEHGFGREELGGILNEAVVRQSALNAISRPAERVIPWFEYREIFLNEERIDAGAEFWVEHADRVAATSERFGVDPEMILAILGIETLFGERMGTYRVVDALSTLAFAYPPRADFFASELESFLLIYAEEGPVVLDALGSYAGAMGAGQFIPSSYRAYAVDGDSDGHRDLWQNWDDILASVANYLAVHGWRLGEPVAVRASQGTAPGVEPGNRLGLDTTVGALRDRGFGFDADLERETPAMLVAVEGDASTTAYFVGLNNFHVITRYNRSVKYALAAVELSEAIRRRFREIQSVSEGDNETL
ncbi:MAG: lytic murein transglycosylase B [Gammaproteobacteria bacterium]|jgi:membrane-bound lytic murein transglycosylase B